MTDRRISLSWAAKQIVARLLSPRHALRRTRLRRNHRSAATVYGNAQLLLYSRMLRGDFLHYGYFDDPATAPETISFDGLRKAQLRYAEKVIDAIGAATPDAARLLDAGSGMGGMLGIYSSAGFSVTGLTPDRFQAEHIRRSYPGVPVLECRFEDLAPASTDTGGPAEEPGATRPNGPFDTIVHAESVQYMNPARVFEVADQILATGGKWVVADYFRVSAGGERSGWQLDAFRKRIDESGYCVAREEDMTPHVLPTLGFARLLAERIGLPIYDFARDKLRTKRPGAHYVLDTVAERAREELLRSLRVLDPNDFARRKRYLLMTLRRK